MRRSAKREGAPGPTFGGIAQDCPLSCSEQDHLGVVTPSAPCFAPASQQDTSNQFSGEVSKPVVARSGDVKVVAILRR